MRETYGSRHQADPELALVTPYHFMDEQLTVSDRDWPGDLTNSTGSVWSSIHDMSLWGQFLLRNGVTASGERLISETNFEQMFEPHQLAATSDFYPTVELTLPHWRTYRLGWFQQDFQGRMINFHHWPRPGQRHGDQPAPGILPGHLSQPRQWRRINRNLRKQPAAPYGPRGF